MKKSTNVPATLVASIAAITIVGCGSSRRCEDSLGRKIPDQQCIASDQGRPTGLYTYPHWVYNRGGYYGGGSMYRTTTGGGFRSSTTGGGSSFGGFGGSGGSSSS